MRGTDPLSNQLMHQGVVTSCCDGTITVNIAPDKSECSGCAIASMCTKPEEVTIPFRGNGQTLIGHHVTIAASKGMHTRAMLLFLIIPIIILVSGVILALALGATESLASVIAIATVAVWYLILWSLRSKIRPKATFRLISTND